MEDDFNRRNNNGSMPNSSQMDYYYSPTRSCKLLVLMLKASKQTWIVQGFYRVLNNGADNTFSFPPVISIICQFRGNIIQCRWSILNYSMCILSIFMTNLATWRINKSSFIKYIPIDCNLHFKLMQCSKRETHLHWKMLSNFTGWHCCFEYYGNYLG